MNFIYLDNKTDEAFLLTGSPFSPGGPWFPGNPCKIKTQIEVTTNYHAFMILNIVNIVIVLSKSKRNHLHNTEQKIRSWHRCCLPTYFFRK